MDLSLSPPKTILCGEEPHLMRDDGHIENDPGLAYPSDYWRRQLVLIYMATVVAMIDWGHK